jgi:hypothetical protein
MPIKSKEPSPAWKLHENYKEWEIKVYTYEMKKTCKIMQISTCKTTCGPERDTNWHGAVSVEHMSFVRPQGQATSTFMLFQAYHLKDSSHRR